jgi:hypothetical protein
MDRKSIKVSLDQASQPFTPTLSSTFDSDTNMDIKVLLMLGLMVALQAEWAASRPINGTSKGKGGAGSFFQFNLDPFETKMVKKSYKGHAHFLAVGRVASPVSYTTVALRFDIESTLDLAGHARRNVEEYLNESLDEQVKNRRMTKRERQEFSSLVRRELSPHQTELDTAVNNFRRTYKGTRADVDERSLGAALGVIGSVIGIGSALYSQYETTRLSRKLYHLRAHYRHIRADMKRLEASLRTARRRNYIRGMEHEVVSNLTTAINHYTDKVRRMEDAVFALVEHRLHPEFVPPESLEEIKDYVKRRADTEGWSPAIDLDRELLNLPTSYVKGEQKLVILLHIPYVTNPRTMLRKLYQAETAVVAVADEEKLVRLHTEEPFISVDRVWEHYQVHSAAGLASCTRIGDLRLCQDTILRNKPDTCIAALLLKRTAEAVKYCKQQEISDEEKIIHLYENVFQVAKNTPFSQVCPGEDPQTFKFNTNKRIEATVGCYLKGDTFQASPIRHETQTKTVHHNALLQRLEFTEIEIPPIGQGPLGGATAKEDETEGDEDDEDYEDEEEHVCSFWFLVGDGVLATLLAMAFLWYLKKKVWDRCCRRSTHDTKERGMSRITRGMA